MEWNCEPYATLHATYLGGHLLPAKQSQLPMITVMSVAYENERLVQLAAVYEHISLTSSWQLDGTAKHPVVGARG